MSPYAIFRSQRRSCVRSSSLPMEAIPTCSAPPSKAVGIFCYVPLRCDRVVGGFFQWLGESGLQKSFNRDDFSSGWMDWDAEWGFSGVILPVAGGFIPLRCV